MTWHDMRVCAEEKKFSTKMWFCIGLGVGFVIRSIARMVKRAT